MTGYFVPGTSGRQLRDAVAPARLLDSRVGTGLAGKFSLGTPAHASRSPGAVACRPSAVAVTGNLTVTDQTAAGYVFLGPDPTDRPDHLRPSTSRWVTAGPTG